MPLDELTADIAVEVFFNDEAMLHFRNDHQQKSFLMNEAPIAPRWAPNCFGQKSHKDNATKLFVNGE